MYPVAWENARYLDEDIIIQGYRIPSKVRKKEMVIWRGVPKVSDEYTSKLTIFEKKITQFSDRSYCDLSFKRIL